MKRSTSTHSIEEKGEHGGHDFQIQAVDPSSGRQISLWHDISLVHIDPRTQQPTPYLNFVCEIPKFTRYDARQRKSRKRVLRMTCGAFESSHHPLSYLQYVSFNALTEKNLKLLHPLMVIRSFKTRRTVFFERSVTQRLLL